MSTEHADQSLHQDNKYPVSNASPDLPMAALSQAIHENLTSVATNVNDFLENLEPALARMSHNMHGHAAIAPAPINQVDHDLHGSNGLTTNMGPTSMETAASIAASGLAASGLDGPSPEITKSKRLNRACDACSRRKVKCDNERPCKNCRDLGIECTFQRPTKRRGPINRVAEEIKRMKRAHPALAPAGIPDYSQPGADPTDVPPYFASVELIGPLEAIQRFARLFFLYIYPLHPFPHEPSFLSNLENRVDIQDPKFVALIASLVGISAASFPSLVRDISVDFDLDFDGLVERCNKVATDVRGPQFMLHADFNVYDAITSFFLGLMGARTDRWTQFRLYMGEAAAILQMINLQKIDIESPQNLIDIELASRLQAAIYTETQATIRLGGNYSLFVPGVIPPSPESMPAEVDDSAIHYDHIDPSADITPPITIGANVITHLYAASAFEKFVPGSEYTEAYRESIEKAIDNCKRIILAAPPELTSPLGPEIAPNIFMDDKQRQQARLDVQKAAIQMTALACRTYAALTLRETGGPLQQATSELQSVAMELAFFLKKLQLVHVEPQWLSFINKMKLMVTPMEDMKDSNEDAAFVVLRMAEFEN